jgi:hypothetical protein
MRAPLQAPDVAVPETEQGTDCESVYVDSNSTGHPNSAGSVNGTPPVFEAGIECSTHSPAAIFTGRSYSDLLLTALTRATPV